MKCRHWSKSFQSIIIILTAHHQRKLFKILKKLNLIIVLAKYYEVSMVGRYVTSLYLPCKW